MDISDITREAIIDELGVTGVSWAGRFEEPDFLARLYRLRDLPSHDRRFDDAYGDIVQHRVNNLDWDDDWVFGDQRFALMTSDQEFVAFLAETVHPRVRTDRDEAAALVEMYNRHLRHDGWAIREVGRISNRPVFAGERLLTNAPALAHVEDVVRVGDMAYLSRQITRMQSAIEDDPELAIGTAKELVETCCHTILGNLDVEVRTDWDLSRLVKETATVLRVTPGDIADDSPGAASSRRVLGSLGAIVQGVAELRNNYGTGHGKAAGRAGLGPRHARLAVGAASTLATFLFETAEERH